ncbi:MAG TPA: hypothetical protein VLW83_02005, partial [Candidatus Acidoferrales bacterium]|nr:hypothetical protein [Candidatus Acidoferrales bacterium]
TMIENDSYVLSPDGRELAFFAISPDGVERLWIRDFGSLDARPLIGSEVTGEVLPFFWSPDSRFIAFWTDRKLKKISISGGPAETICDLPAGEVGGAWSRAGVIIFGQGPGALMRVSADGGSASPVTAVRPPYDVAHVFPSFLPDGRHFIYLRASSVSAKDGIYVGSLDAKPEDQDSNRLLATDVESDFVPSPDSGSGQLLFIRDGALLAQPFDARRLALSGEPVAVAEHVGTFRTRGLFSASSNGVLVYKTTDASGAQLTWFDRQGAVVGAGGQRGSYYSLALSPDGGRAVVSQFSSLNPRPLLWLLDFSRGTHTQFTFGASDASSAVWSPDGSRVVFNSTRDGKFDLYEKLASGAKDEELLLKSGEDKIPTSWSHDGRFLLYTATDSNSKYEIWALSLEGNKKPFPFLRAEFDNDDGQFSPDGRLVAYSSDESGRDEIYVRAFSPDSAAAGSDAGGKWLISTGGGIQPRWRGDGKELYYLALDGKLMAVDIATNPVFRAGLPRALFQAPPDTGGIAGVHAWGLTPDGKRFLFLAPVEQATQAPFTVVLNWQAGLKK